MVSVLSGFLSLLNALRLRLRVGEVIPVKKRQVLVSRLKSEDDAYKDDEDADAVIQSFWWGCLSKLKWFNFIESQSLLCRYYLLLLNRVQKVQVSQPQHPTSVIFSYLISR